ncbi:MAG: cytochrome c3 family protein [Kofleriaceae bacterium]|nr:cytochrome c3 family protein [Kofleriaceae bacterium]
MRSHRGWSVLFGGAVLGAVVGVCVLVAALWSPASPSEPAPARAATSPSNNAPAAFVGEAVCASCHAREAAAWRGSDHQRAMQPATSTTVLGDFDNATFTHGGVTSQLFRRNGKPMVRTDGPDGALHDYEVTHTFGVTPLQQYLVPFPRGRLQALEIAWDSRPKDQGGQRWFHLYPDEKIDHADPLHWTGVAENWNYMCADCHSTNVRKGWSAQTASYATTFTEMSVACEACHGPGSQHVAWANAPSDRRGTAHGLVNALDERANVVWTRDARNKPVRSQPRATEREVDTCARCHARRGLIHEDVAHGQPIGDDYAVALLDDDLYYPDGQIKDEVYEYGSFVQSRMFAHGVTCSDCHDPHSQKLRAPGDQVCLTCHATETYVSAKHHFHAEGSAGARCVSCHMPASTYMVVDPRRDHSLRVPRPDQTVALGVPNACNGCHADRSPAWAAQQVATWYGHAPSGFQQFGEALAAGTRGSPEALRLLAAVIGDAKQPAIARASAIARLERWRTPETLALVTAALRDPSPLVRRAAVQALETADPRMRAAVVAPLLDDPVRAVRIEAASVLADVTPERLPSTWRASQARAVAELVAVQELNGDRPEAHLTLAALHVKQQAFERAEAELQHALAIDPGFVPAAVNLADLYRTLGRDADAEPTLRKALARAPQQPALLHALGLVLVRQNRTKEAIASLGAAARLGTDNPRNGYVYAVALHSAGRRAEATRELNGVLRLHPYDRDVLAALIAFHREAKQSREALGFAERLAALDPQDAAMTALVRELRAQVTP